VSRLSSYSRSQLLGPSVYDPFSSATQDDPYESYAALLETAPVYHNEERDFFALSRFDDVQAGFRDWRTFSSARGVTVDELLAITGPSMLTIDPPRHDGLRDVIKHVFRPPAIAALEPGVRRIVGGLLADVGPESEIDVVAVLARRLPVLVICELLGFPAVDAPTLKSWGDAILERVPDDDSTPKPAREAAALMRAYFEEQIADRRRGGVDGDDLVSVLLRGRIDGGPLTPEELIGHCFVLFIAGNATTSALIGNGTLVLARHPHERARLAADPALGEPAVEELLRFESPVQNMGRTTTRDVELHGTTIPAGARVLLLIGAANRDPGAFDDPGRLDLGRRIRRHLAFGEGIHHCIGAPLARLEGRVALGTLVELYPDYEVSEVERFRDVTERSLSRLLINTGRTGARSRA
jgi:cytochrome P450